MPRTRGTLARRYRRLLVCYPRRYRQARGEEIVATFLDLAPPERDRPTIREAVNLVRHGLRCRLGRPKSRTVVLWAAATAIAMWYAPIALAAPQELKNHLDEPHPSWQPLWEWLGQPALATLFVVGTGAALLALAASALPRRAAPATDARSPA